MGVWIETIKNKAHFNTFSHTLYGCVDWNPSWLRKYIGSVVTPCMGVWIETDIQKDILNLS